MLKLIPDNYIQGIEKNYYWPRTSMKQSNKDKINLNKYHKEMIESFCDYPVSVILKDRVVGSTTIICSFIVEYCMKNPGCIVFIKSANDRTFQQIIKRIRQLYYSNTNHKLLKIDNKIHIGFDNDSDIGKFKDKHNLIGYQDIVYIDEVTHHVSPEINKLFDDLKYIWDSGMKPRIIMDGHLMWTNNNRFDNLVSKAKNNSNVNIVHVNKK